MASGQTYYFAFVRLISPLASNFDVAFRSPARLQARRSVGVALARHRDRLQRESAHRSGSSARLARSSICSSPQAGTAPAAEWPAGWRRRLSADVYELVAYRVIIRFAIDALSCVASRQLATIPRSRGHRVFLLGQGRHLRHHSPRRSSSLTEVSLFSRRALSLLTGILIIDGKSRLCLKPRKHQLECDR